MCREHLEEGKRRKGGETRKGWECCNVPVDVVAARASQMLRTVPGVSFRGG
jgi:hypothetical protein